MKKLKITHQIDKLSEKFNNKSKSLKIKQKNERKNKNYIILIRKKSHLQFRISNMMTCINKNLRKASRIRKVKKRSDLNIIIKCIRITHKQMRVN